MSNKSAGVSPQNTLTADSVTDSASRPATISAAHLKAPPRPKGDNPAVANDTTDRAPTDAAPDPEKGGKGGTVQPPLPLSNAAFVESVVRDLPADSHAAVCSKPEDPATSGWPAQRAENVDTQCPAGRNNYLNCSTFLSSGDGVFAARVDSFSAFHFLLLDDVGTKVARSKLHGFTSTWEIETSPGNYQVGIRLCEPLRAIEDVTRLQNAIIAAGLCDKGASGAARWARLPCAINGKSKHRTDAGTPFECRLTAWHPDVAYTPNELASALGLILTTSQAGLASANSPRLPSSTFNGSSNVFTPKPTENPVLTALRERGLYKREISPGKHDVTCPWANDHTDGLDSGAAYFEPDVDRAIGGFVCQHSHRDQYNIANLIDFLNVNAEAARGKPRIDVIPGELNRVRRAAERTLAEKGGYFQAGGAIVSVRIDPATGDMATELLSEPALTSVLSDTADWYRHDGRIGKSVRCDPPARYVQALLKAQQFDYLPNLTGLARQPFFREHGGELVTTPGYDVTTGRYASFDAHQFAVVPKPTKADAQDALAVLDGLLDEFVFATQADRSATLSAMITAAVRPSLPVAPAFNITASTPGSGKSYLASTIIPFAGPGTAHKVSYPTTAEEATKAMLSIFVGAPAVVLFDDMQADWIPHGAINRALTSDTMTERLLGASRTVTASTRSLMMGTGNNVVPVRDMTRRVVTIRLHPKTATPALNSYVGRPAETVRADRGKYVAAALTIVAAYRAAGSPKANVPSIASFGSWSDMCREPLIWLDQPDPATSIITQLQHDPDQDNLGGLLRAWHKAFGDAAVMLRRVVDACSDDQDLHDALLELPVSDREIVNRSKLGWFLRKNANRIVDGYELQSAHCSTRNAWRVVKLEPDAPAPD